MDVKEFMHKAWVHMVKLHKLGNMEEIEYTRIHEY
jgi:hypothetical protein